MWRSSGPPMQVVELVRAACAVLQQCRDRIATGVNLDGIELVIRGSYIAASHRLARVNVGIGIIPAILRVQSVGQQDDHMGVLVEGIVSRYGERSAADQ